MGLRSRRKGKVGEREAAKAWSAAVDCEARRGVQFQGGAESPDVSHKVDGVHIEVKRTARGYNTQAAIEQAREDAKPGNVPVVLSRQDRGEWIASVPLSELMALVDILAEQKWKVAKGGDA
jgi:hypothetical protein